jgi:hypothetical protein
MSDVPASVLRRRELFARIREDVKRLNVDGSGLTDKTDAEIIKELEDLERPAAGEVRLAMAELERGAG